MKILVTGGAGYIGSHTCLELLQAGFEVIVVDNLSNASVESINRVEQLSGQKIPFYQIDIRDKRKMDALFKHHAIDEVIHFAGLKAVGESVLNPLQYFDNNVSGTIALCEVMRANNCKTMVFSSSATVYGQPLSVPIKENFPLSATNPYGRSKLMIEELLRDVFVSDSTWRIALLRYFNPIGAHASGRIGENPHGEPNNLMPYIAEVAIGKRDKLRIFGNDYNTPDGTGVRDYIHVVDLAMGHVKALHALKTTKQVLTINLGTGNGYSVLEMVSAFEAASGKSVPYEIMPRRKGDVDKCYADPSLAKQILHWQATANLQQMCSDTWRWQSNNPTGYSKHR